jgi:hypothetical protein
MDCSNCKKVVEINPLSHVCNMGSAKYVISDYPSQGENCNLYELKNQGRQIISGKKRYSFFQSFKRGNVDDAERKILEAYDRNVGLKSYSSNSIRPSSQEVNVKSALGWIVAAILAGALIASWLLF